MTWWQSVKSGFRQWYVTLATFAILGLLDLFFSLPAPTEGAWYWVIVAAVLSFVKTFEKKIRAKVAEWLDTW